jgi:hypothetical protein
MCQSLKDAGRMTCAGELTASEVDGCRAHEGEPRKPLPPLDSGSINLPVPVDDEVRNRQIITAVSKTPALFGPQSG